MSDTPTLANVAAPPPAAIPQQTNSPFHQPIAPPGPGSARPAPPNALEWTRMSAAERFDYERSVTEGAVKGGTGFVHSRDAHGNPTIVDRATGRPVDGTAPAGDDRTNPGDQPAQPADAGEKVKIGQYEISEAELGAMMQRQAAEDLRKATVPPTPGDYKLEISPDAKLPGDGKFQFDANDPGLVAAKAWAHSKSLDQRSFSEMLTLYASHVAQQNATLAARAQEEIAKAGVNAPQRVDAVVRWIRSEVGDADARPIAASLCTDSHLRFYEKLMTKVTSQGTAPFSQQHRDRPDPGKVDDATWATWNDAQKFEYARSFSATERNYQLPQHR